MKRLLIAATLSVGILSLSSCKDDEKGPGYSFKNQNASGEIDGAVWTYEDGYVWIDDSDDEPYLIFNIFPAQDDDACDVIFADGGSISFEVPAEIGVYKLSSDFIVTFLDDEMVNRFAKSGAVEIVSITETSVTGKIDARSDDDNFVNGNFTVNFCD